MHTYIHACMCACRHTYIHTHMRTCCWVFFRASRCCHFQVNWAANALPLSFFMFQCCLFYIEKEVEWTVIEVAWVAIEKASWVSDLGTRFPSNWETPKTLAWTPLKEQHALRRWQFWQNLEVLTKFGTEVAARNVEFTVESSGFEVS